MILKYKNTISRGNQNTYKFALGFAILDRYDGTKRLSFADLSESIAKMYYRNHVVFKLRETNNASQEPNAVSIIKAYVKEHWLAQEYTRRLPGSSLKKLAGLFVEPPSGFRRNFFDYVLPCWQGASRDNRGYFIYPPRGANEFFSYDKFQKEIILTDDFLTCIREHREVLLDLTIMGWAQFLEKFNLTPNLIMKLKAKKLGRRLEKFRVLFRTIAELEASVCFLCRRPVVPSNLTLDHVVPFDFVYTDELWNLVPACRECNSRKNMKVGSDKLVLRLVERNKRLYRVAVESQVNLRPWISDQFSSPEELQERLQQLIRDCVSAGYPVDATYS